MRLMIVLIGLLLIGCTAEINQVSINDVVIEVEVADSDEEKARGLMYRESLDEDKGMLFVYDDENERSFWMKNTLIPLDILFIDAEKTIVDIQTMEPCKEEPCRNYISGSEAQYALEVNA